MKTNYLIYYVLKLITKGQEWQYKNLNGKGDRPYWVFYTITIDSTSYFYSFCLHKA